MTRASMNQQLRRIAAETVAIVDEGGYQAPSGVWVDLAGAVRDAVAGTQLHLPDDQLVIGGSHVGMPLIDVTNESTLAAGRRLGAGTAALVFASARNPGGGFLTGARAQEEDLARASALHACLNAVPDFYSHHRSDRDLRYSDRIIHSPKVPVFRDEAGTLLDRPYLLSMITCAAPNLTAIRANQPDLAESVPVMVRARALRVLQVAAAHGHRRLVLGAWGCGVFGNDPAVVAEAFAAALQSVKRFDTVVFAVLDRTSAAPTYHTFADIIRAEFARSD